ncbi:WYL domain-containing protein [Segatella copri]|uniref:WYL domain-containing protein n=1 Tax=Segatella copri TaxID=165179 RepID=UPI00222F4C7B|nr:WYL domain-containing protein [Segatella copri]MCW4121961.1 WYL domain-containing protein [Segatella copri]
MPNLQVYTAERHEVLPLPYSRRPFGRNRGSITLREIQSRWKKSELNEGTELSRRTFINNLHAIVISYYSYNTEKYYEFDIHPYFVKAFKKRWYVVAYSPGTNDIHFHCLFF